MTARLGLALSLVCALVAVIAAPLAQAEVVYTPSGHFIAVTPVRGKAPATLPGAVAAGRFSGFSAQSLTRPFAGGGGFSAQGDLPGADRLPGLSTVPALSAMTAATTGAGAMTWHGGAVMHSSAPYLIFWTPPGQSIPASTESLLERYFTDVAAGSGSANVYAVTRQYTDSTGFADYSQTFSSAAQALTDTAAYPTRDAPQCPDVASDHPICITDAQLESELSREIAAARLPTDGPSSGSSLPANAPVYFVVLPTDVSVCFSDGTPQCATSAFCAYHSSYVDGHGNNVVYGAIPTWTVGPAGDAKACQTDGNNAGQEPNASPADVVINYQNHEDTEALTDPTGYGYWNDSSGNEEADNCNAYGSASPQYGTSPTAFTPTLGGSAPAGTLYNQTIGHNYYLQSEWSNGDGTCELKPSSATVTPSFTAPAGQNMAGAQLTFNPAASTSSAGLSGASWSFGDGGTAFYSGPSALTAASHSYSAAGAYTVTLRLIDSHGNLATTTRTVTVQAPPTAKFTAVPVTEGQTTTFDASASTDPNAGATITSYAWNFGDGHTGTGAKTGEPYTQAGTYTVTLTVTDSLGLTSTTTQSVIVPDERPTAAFAVTTGAPTVGQPTALDASNSGDSDGTISSYAWSFGDGTTGTSATPTHTHTYTAGGTYTVTLTVTDSDGQRATISHQVAVAGPSPAFSSTPATESQSTNFDASASTDSQPTVTLSYTWDFGDSSPTAAGPTATHTYAHAGIYTVTLTVSDSAGLTSVSTQQVTVADEPPMAVFTAQQAALGDPVSFDGTRSADSDGSIGTYVWNFGDGTTGTTPTPTHTYAASGTYTVTLTITDSDGETATVSHAVAVQMPAIAVQSAHTPPVAAFSLDGVPPVAEQSLRFDATKSHDSNATIAAYAWSFGDGSANATGATPHHAYRAPGVYDVTLTVTNNWGQRASTSHAIRVVAPHVTGVKVGSTSAGPVLLVGVDAPGWVRADGRTVTMRAAGTARVRLRLTQTQTDTLTRAGWIKLRYTVTFAPSVGARSTQRVAVVFRRIGGRVAGTLAR